MKHSARRFKITLASQTKRSWVFLNGWTPSLFQPWRRRWLFVDIFKKWCKGSFFGHTGANCRPIYWLGLFLILNVGLRVLPWTTIIGSYHKPPASWTSSLSRVHLSSKSVGGKLFLKSNGGEGRHPTVPTLGYFMMKQWGETKPVRGNNEKYANFQWSYRQNNIIAFILLGHFSSRIER